jgi:hypothetical protein
MATRPARAVNLAKQLLAIRQVLEYVDGRVSGGELACDLRLQPTPASRRYTLHLVYRHGTRPRVTVTDPPLHLYSGARHLPHVYTGNVLCLNYPGEWQEDMLLADTVVPWASELLHL